MERGGILHPGWLCFLWLDFLKPGASEDAAFLTPGFVHVWLISRPPRRANRSRQMTGDVGRSWLETALSLWVERSRKHLRHLLAYLRVCTCVSVRAERGKRKQTIERRRLRAPLPCPQLVWMGHALDCREKLISL